MADINIEKKNSSILRWLLGLLLLAAVAFAAWVFLGDREADLAEDPAVQSEPYEAPPPPASIEPAPGDAPGEQPPASTTTGL